MASAPARTAAVSPPGATRVAERPRAVDLSTLGQAGILGSTSGDVAVGREEARLRRLRRVAALLALPAALLVARAVQGGTITWGPPTLPAGASDYLPALALVALFAIVLVVPLLGAGRSPHVLYRANEIDVSLDDVKGAGASRTR
jgi:hypothetical protein